MDRMHELLEEQKKRHHEHHRKLRLTSIIIFIVVCLFLLLYVWYMEQALTKLSETQKHDLPVQSTQGNY